MNILEIAPLKYKIYLEETVSIETNLKLQEIKNCILSSYNNIIDLTISYNCLMFESASPISIELLQDDIENISNSTEFLDKEVKLIEIPVCYDAEYAMDMEYVMEYTGLSKDEIIDLHTKQVYYVYFIGFLPGFPYLGGLDKRLHTPRKDVPRLRIPAGSVGIGGSQTGIYPLNSPGGWQIIGRTPLKIFDPTREAPFLISSGECIKFIDISKEDYLTLKNNETVKPISGKISLKKVIYAQGS